MSFVSRVKSLFSTRHGPTTQPTNQPSNAADYLTTEKSTEEDLFRQMAIQQSQLLRSFDGKLILFYVSLFCGALVLFLVSEYLQTGEHIHSILTQSSTYSELFKEAGYAFIIAIALAVTVEASSRRESLRETSRQMALMSENVFGALFGVFLPKTLVDQVRETILKSDFIREHYWVRYYMDVVSIQVAGATTEIVRISAFHEYVVQNVSVGAKDFPVSIDVTDPPRSAGWPPDTVDDVFVNRVPITPTPVTAAAGGSGVHTEDHLRFQHMHTVKQGDRIEVKIAATYHRTMDDNEMAVCVVPALRMSLRVQMPGQIKKFGASAMHPSKARMVSAAESAREFEWTIDEPVLPSQGMYFWWRRD